MSMIGPILFLDIDNVLNGDGTPPLKADMPCAIERHIGFTWLCNNRIEQLNKILDAVPNTKVVLSSTWRTYGIEPVLAALKSVGYRHSIDDRTPLRFSYSPRDMEILSWFNENDLDYKTVTFCILDDLPMVNIPYFQNRHIQTTHYANETRPDGTLDIAGFTDSQVAQAIKILTTSPANLNYEFEFSLDEVL
jgi:hypothetical protein